MDSIISVSNYVLKQTGYSISNLWLNKILYLVYGVITTVSGKRPWPEQPEPWTQGPVFPTPYYEFKMWGSSRIKYSTLNENLSDSIKIVVDEVLDTYGILTLSELILLTERDNSPWARAYKSATKISDEDIKHYFAEYIIKGERST